MTVRTAPAAGAVVEKVTRTRTLPDSEENTDKPWRTMDVWDYLASLTAAEWQQHIAYLYRIDEKQNPWALGKFTTAIDQFKIQELYGGGYFNLKVKRGPMLILNEDFRIEGPMKTPGAAASNGSSGGSASGNDSALLVAVHALIEELRASRGGNMMTEGMRSVMAAGGAVLTSGAEAVKSAVLSVTPASHPNPMSSPLDALTFLKAAKDLFGTPQTNSLKDTLEMISALKGSGLLSTGGSDRGGIAMELVRHVPQVAQQLGNVFHDWRMAEEARARAASAMRGGAPPISVAAAPSPGGTLAVMPSPVEIPATPPTPQQAQQMAIEVIEQGIVNIVNNPNISVEEAANQACSLIDNMMPGMVDQMIQWGEEGIQNLFNTRPILAQIPKNPRLTEFIKKFLEVGKAAPVVLPAPPADTPVA